MNCVIWEGTCVTEATGTAVRSDKVDYFLETCFENFVRRREPGMIAFFQLYSRIARLRFF